QAPGPPANSAFARPIMSPHCLKGDVSPWKISWVLKSAGIGAGVGLDVAGESAAKAGITDTKKYTTAFKQRRDQRMTFPLGSICVAAPLRGIVAARFACVGISVRA